MLNLEGKIVKRWSLRYILEILIKFINLFYIELFYSCSWNETCSFIYRNFSLVFELEKVSRRIFRMIREVREGESYLVFFSLVI